jgi:peptidoglycan/LPS O-acetylase OafA/YrhL
MKRVAAVDAVRAFSLLSVLAVHLLYAAPAARQSAFWLVARNGFYGVTLFLVISGYVITRSLLEREPDLARLDLRAFYLRRVGRIVPLFALVVVVGVIGWALLPDSSRTAFCVRSPGARYDLGFWLSLPTLTFNWVRVGRPQAVFGLHWDVLWSLAIEEQFYLFYPLLLRGLGTSRRVAYALALAAAIGPVARAVARARYPGLANPIYMNSFAAFEHLATGALLALYLHSGRGPRFSTEERRLLWPIGVLGLTGVVLVYADTWLIDLEWAMSALGWSTAAFLLAAVELDWCKRLAWITYPGQLSYGGYLLHASVLWVAWPLVQTLPVAASFPLFAGATFLVAELSHRLIEAPLNRRIRAVIPRGAAAGARRAA